MVGGNSTHSERKMEYDMWAEFFHKKYSERGAHFEHYKVLAIEGSTLTFLGNLTYNMSEDKVTLDNPIAFVGGGLDQI